MRKTCILIFSLLFTVFVFAQKKLPNTKIGKNETEITSFILADDSWVLGGQLAYRIYFKKNLKIGAGGLYAANYNYSPIQKNALGYGAAFADIMQFIGHRQKWSLGGQMGLGFYKSRFGNTVKIKTGVYYSISGNYRAIVSRRLLISVSPFIGFRKFHYFAQILPENNPGLIGLRLGIVF